MPMLSARPAAAPTGGATTPLGGVVSRYRRYLAGKLAELAADVAKLQVAVATGNRDAARRRWLAAQLTWQQLGAAFESFGPAYPAISGLANGLPGGVADPRFTGLHRIEWGLYHDESMPRVLPYVVRLATEVAGLRADTVDIVPAELPIRCHEMLEDALRDHLSEQDDYGSGMAYALTSADVLGTRVVLEELRPLLTAPPGPSAYQRSKAGLDALDAALEATKVHHDWPDYRTLSKHQRQPVNAAIGGALESLSQVPFLLGGLT